MHQDAGTLFTLISELFSSEQIMAAGVITWAGIKIGVIVVKLRSRGSIVGIKLGVVGVAIKGDVICGEENAAELLLEDMAVGRDIDSWPDGVEVSEGWGLLEGVYLIVIVIVLVTLLIFASVSSNETVGITV
jgi:hypothetical protein